MLKRSKVYIIAYILLLRAKVGARLLKSLGWIRSITVLVTLGILVFPVFEVLTAKTASVYFVFFFWVIISSIHFYRKDHYFIQLVDLRKQLLFFCEYLFVGLPVWLILGYLGAWGWMLGGIAGCFIVACLPAWQNSPGSTKSVQSMPALISYEWASGLRKYKWPLMLLLLGALVAGMFNLFLGWVAIFLITATVALFYRYCEPVQFILLENKGAVRFLGQKLLQGSGYYVVLTSPLWIVMVMFHSDYFIYIVLFFLGNLFLLTAVIVGKYAFFRANRNIEAMISIIFWMSLICLLIPYLLPVLFLLIFWLFWRGTKRLREEVYAFH